MITRGKVIIGLIVVLALSAAALTYFLLIEDMQHEDGELVKGDLTIYNWKDYIGSDTVSKFEQEFGIKVNYLTFDDEEEMFSALQSEPSKYDLLVASNDIVTDLVRARLIQVIDHKNIPNLKNIASQFRDPAYDPDNRHSVPYLWGTTGMIINTSKIGDEPDSWKLLWDPKYKGRIAMLNNAYSVFLAPLAMMGVEVNTNDIEKIEAAGEMLKKQGPLLVGYLEATDIRDRMISGELFAAQLYSGEAMQAVEKNEDLVYFFPKEGGELWIDSFIISAGARNRRGAEKFIDFVLRPEVGAAIANELWYATCDGAAKPFLDPEMLSDPLVYPPPEVREGLHMWEDQGTPEEVAKAEMKINEIWAMLKHLHDN